MLRLAFKAVLAVVVLAGGLLAAEGVVVKYSENKLVVKVDGKERTIEFKKGRPHVHGPDGKKLKTDQYKEFLKEGAKVDIEEEGGKVTEVTIKK